MCKTQLLCMIFSRSRDTQNAGLSFQQKSYMLRVSSILTTLLGDGCCTVAEFLCYCQAKVMLLSSPKLTSDRDVPASEIQTELCGCARNV